jgi:hypothetical protein
LLVSVTPLLVVQVTRTRAVVVAGPVTVQLKVPEDDPFATEAAMTVHVDPPFRLTSTLLVLPVGRL